MRQLYANGGIVEVFGGPESGRTSYVKACLKECSKLPPCIVTTAFTEYIGFPRAYHMSATNSLFLIPAIRELLFCKRTDSVVIDPLQDFALEAESVQKWVMQQLPTLLLPLYYAKAVLYIINNDSYVPTSTASKTRILTTPGGKFFSVAADCRVFCPHAKVPPITV